MDDKSRSRAIFLFVLSSYAAAASTTSSAAAQSTPTAAPTLVGCFSSFTPLVKQDTYKFQSSGHCWGVCSDINKPVLGLADGVSCWCGDELPAADTKVPSSKCNTPCEGYNLEDCGGGTEYFTVWLTGTESNVPNYNGNDPQSIVSSSTVASSSIVTTKTSDTQTSATQTSSSATISPEPQPTSESSIAGNRAGNRAKRIKSHDQQRIILGVVLGLTAFTAIVATVLLVWWCMRRQRRRHGRHMFQRNKPPSLSEAPLAGNAERMSVISTSTYSSRRSPAFVERTGRAIAAMQLALGPKTRERNDQHISQASTSVESGQPNMRTYSTELDAQDYRNVIDHQSIETHQPPLSPTPGPQSPLANIMEEPSKHSKSMSVMVSASEIVSPISPIHEEPFRKQTRSLMIHYPSWSEVDGFDFSGDVKDRDGVKGRQSWHPMRERKDGRYELA